MMIGGSSIDGHMEDQSMRSKTDYWNKRLNIFPWIITVNKVGKVIVQLEVDKTKWVNTLAWEF